MYIAVDFDGTVVQHKFPEVGEDVPGAERVLRRIVEKGHKLILYTMRSNVVKPESSEPGILNIGGDFLDDAVTWYSKKGIPLYGIQENPSQKSWTTSPKPYFHQLVDDAATGCPLIYPGGDSRPYVDWDKIEKLFEDQGII